MTQLETIKQRLADLSSTEPETVRAAYEWLANNARENTRALVAIIDSLQPSPASCSLLDRIGALLFDMESEDEEVAKKARDDFSAGDKALQICKLLYKSERVSILTTSAVCELLQEYARFAAKHNWKISKDLQTKTNTILSTASAALEVKLK